MVVVRGSGKWWASGSNAERNSLGPCGEKLDKEQRTARRLRLSHTVEEDVPFFHSSCYEMRSRSRVTEERFTRKEHGTRIRADNAHVEVFFGQAIRAATKKGQVADYRSLAISPKFTRLQDDAC